MPKRKQRKPLVGTWYAYQEIKSGLWWAENKAEDYRSDYLAETERGALLTPTRTDVDETKIRVVGFRCRALSTRTKASPKRTR